MLRLINGIVPVDVRLRTIRIDVAQILVFHRRAPPRGVVVAAIVVGLDAFPFGHLISIVRRTDGVVLALSRIAGALRSCTSGVSHGYSSTTSSRNANAIAWRDARLQAHGCGREPFGCEQIGCRMRGGWLAVDFGDQHALVSLLAPRGQLEKSERDLANRSRPARLGLRRKEDQLAFAAPQVRGGEAIDQDDAGSDGPRRGLG